MSVGDSDRRFARRLADVAADRYRRAGTVHHRFARGKLRHDPMFADVLQRGRLGAGGGIVDLGCGRGLLFAAILASRDLQRDGAWPPDWPPPPAPDALVGVERSPAAVRAARIALGDEAVVEQADLSTFVPGACDVVVLFDVLHYLPAAVQERLLARIAGALSPGGRLLIREADRTGGVRFVVTALAERARAIGRAQPCQRFAYRAASEWSDLLRTSGLAVVTEPLADGTPFANVLITATRPSA